jgi:hypothetical protein
VFWFNEIVAFKGFLVVTLKDPVVWLFTELLSKIVWFWIVCWIHGMKLEMFT